jgi:hypothetical protein
MLRETKQNENWSTDQDTAIVTSTSQSHVAQVACTDMVLEGVCSSYSHVQMVLRRTGLACIQSAAAMVVLLDRGVQPPHPHPAQSGRAGRWLTIDSIVHTSGNPQNIWARASERLLPATHESPEYRDDGSRYFLKQPNPTPQVGNLLALSVLLLLGVCDTVITGATAHASSVCRPVHQRNG